MLKSFGFERTLLLLLLSLFGLR